MSRLELFGRPFVAFDPANPEHRRYYHDFVLNGTWGRCPVRFLCPDDHGDLVTVMQRALVAWYTKDEFKSNKKVSKRLDK